jgi:hypothetical protein
LRHPLVKSTLRAERNLLNRINLMLAVQSSLQKNFCSLLTQITSTSIAIPPSQEGRIAIVTDVEAGCDGRGMSGAQ